MAFIPITIECYIKKHLKNNPNDDKNALRKKLNNYLNNYKNGIKCHCGNDIWVIGSAMVENNCYTCITGESYPTDDYEIDSAIVKSKSKKGLRHIDDIEPSKIAGFYNDDGYEINTHLIKNPGLCITCIHNDDPNEELLCNMTRYDQRNDKVFKCFAYNKSSNNYI